MNSFDQAGTMVISAVKVIFKCHIIVMKLFMNSLVCTLETN
jgi:hypothetical protein